MNDSNISEPIIPKIISDPGLKDYKCPHCHKFLFRGKVKKINMVCHNCQKLINVSESELLKQDSESQDPEPEKS